MRSCVAASSITSGFPTSPRCEPSLQAGAAGASAQDFYFLARTCLVKDERHYDRFDRVFAEVFQGAERLFAELTAAQVPAAWLQALAGRVLSEEERRAIESLGGWEKLLVWLNPEPAGRQEHTASVRILKELVGERMFPLTLQGLDSAIAELRRTSRLPWRKQGVEIR